MFCCTSQRFSRELVLVGELTLMIMVTEKFNNRSPVKLELLILPAGLSLSSRTLEPGHKPQLEAASLSTGQQNINPGAWRLAIDTQAEDKYSPALLAMTNLSSPLSPCRNLVNQWRSLTCRPSPPIKSIQTHMLISRDNSFQDAPKIMIF